MTHGALTVMQKVRGWMDIGLELLTAYYNFVWTFCKYVVFLISKTSYCQDSNEWNGKQNKIEILFGKIFALQILFLQKLQSSSLRTWRTVPPKIRMQFIPYPCPLQ